MAGEFSIADIAIAPRLVFRGMHGIDLSRYARVEEWFERISQRPAWNRGLEAGKDRWGAEPIDDEAKRHLFGQRRRQP